MARVLLSVSAALALSIWLPTPLMLPAIEVVCCYAALAFAISALRRRELLGDAARFNRWDSAMILMALSLLCAVLADEVETMSYLEGVIVRAKQG